MNQRLGSAVEALSPCARTPALSVNVCNSETPHEVHGSIRSSRASGANFPDQLSASLAPQLGVLAKNGHPQPCPEANAGVITPLFQLTQLNLAQLPPPNPAGPLNGKIMENSSIESLKNKAAASASPQVQIRKSRFDSQSAPLPESSADATLSTADTMAYILTILNIHDFDTMHPMTSHQDGVVIGTLTKDPLPNPAIAAPSNSQKLSAPSKTDLQTVLPIYAPSLNAPDEIYSNCQNFTSDISNNILPVSSAITPISDHKSLKSLRPENVGLSNAYITGEPDSRKLSIEMQPSELGTIRMTMRLSIEQSPKISLTVADPATLKLMSDDLSLSSVVVEPSQALAHEKKNPVQPFNGTEHTLNSETQANTIYDRGRQHDLYRNAENATLMDTDSGPSNFRRPHHANLKLFKLNINFDDTGEVSIRPDLAHYLRNTNTLQITA